MSTIETRLPGRHTTPAHVVRALNRALGRQPLARVELRYSTQAETPLHAQAAKHAIARLLQEHGQGQAEVSVRAHEGVIDDATGEHLLRLIPQPVAPSSRAHATWWQRVLWALWPWAQAPQTAATGATGRTEPALQPAVPAVSRPQAVKLLREAVADAARIGLIDADGQPSDRGPVAQALVIVRLPDLHAVLEPLVPQDVRAMAAMVQGHGFAVSQTFGVGYRYQPPQGGDGTGYANEGDLEVRLLNDPRPGTKGSKAEAPAGAPASAGQPTAMPGAILGAVPGFTAMPQPSAVVPMLRLRVLGTVDAALERPFELPAMPLPARFDRETLVRVGTETGKHVPNEWLAVVSQKCPLCVEIDEQGRTVLVSSRRAVPGGEQPMYFDARTRKPLPKRMQWPPGQALQVFVNDPTQPLLDGRGQKLPALHLEARLLPV